MAEIFTTPCAKTGWGGFSFLRRLFRGEKLSGSREQNQRLLTAGRALNQGKFDKTLREPLSLAKQTGLARQTRLNVQNTLVQEQPGEIGSFNLNNTVKPVSEVLEDISRNISKMDQNVYAARSNMEEILRANVSNTEFVSMD